MKKELTYLFFIFLTAYSCLDTPDMTVGPANLRDKPWVVSGASAFSPSGGVLSFPGEVLSVGKADKIFERGFYWGFDPGNLTDSVMVESADIQPGAFSGTLSNVRGDTTIYWRAFARNDFGIDTGAIRSTPTPPIFETGENFRALIRLYFASFTLGNNLYVTCGYNTALFSDIKRYDTNHWWYDLPDFPGAARRYPVAFTINDSLAFVGTGQGPGLHIIFGDFYVFNGNTQKWNTEAIQTPAEMPRYRAVAFNLNNKGYVVGGYDGNVSLNDVWEYSITNNTGSWKKKNNFPELFSDGISFCNNGRAFAGFGDNVETDSTLWEYNSMNDSWNKIEFANSPTYLQGGRAKFLSGVMTGGKIYLLDETKIIWELDLATKAFKQKSALPLEFLPLNDQYMFSLGNVIYIGLGGTDLFYRYNPLWDN